MKKPIIIISACLLVIFGKMLFNIFKDINLEKKMSKLQLYSNSRKGYNMNDEADEDVEYLVDSIEQMKSVSVSEDLKQSLSKGILIISEQKLLINNSGPTEYKKHRIRIKQFHSQEDMIVSKLEMRFDCNG